MPDASALSTDVPAEPSDRYDPVPVAVSDPSPPIRDLVRSLIGIVTGLGIALLVAAAWGVGLSGPAAALPVRSVHASAHGVGAGTASPLEASSTVPTTVPGSARPLSGSPPDDSGASASDDRKVWAVVAGLVVVALGLSLLTVRYWRHTRPVAAGPRRPTGRYAREAGDEVIDVDDGSLLFGDLTRGGSTIAAKPEAEPVPELLIDEAPVRRADPGIQADHAQVDADWEPHTMELERVDVTAPAPLRESIEAGSAVDAVRPSRDARAAALRAADPPEQPEQSDPEA